MQVAGREYDNFYIAVVRFQLFRLIMSAALKQNWVTQNVDIKTAFLNADIERNILVRHTTTVSPEKRSTEK